MAIEITVKQSQGKGKKSFYFIFICDSCNHPIYRNQDGLICWNGADVKIAHKKSCFNDFSNLKQWRPLENIVDIAIQNYKEQGIYKFPSGYIREQECNKNDIERSLLWARIEENIIKNNYDISVFLENIRSQTKWHFNTHRDLTLEQLKTISDNLGNDEAK